MRGTRIVCLSCEEVYWRRWRYKKCDRIFRKYNKHFADREKFSAFYKGIATIIRNEIIEVFKDLEVVDKIGGCVRVHLLRKVHYYTELNVNLETRKKTYQLNVKK